MAFRNPFSRREQLECINIQVIISSPCTYIERNCHFCTDGSYWKSSSPPLTACICSVFIRPHHSLLAQLLVLHSLQSRAMTHTLWALVQELGKKQSAIEEQKFTYRQLVLLLHVQMNGSIWIEGTLTAGVLPLNPLLCCPSHIYT